MSRLPGNVVVGAPVPFIEYEAENAHTNGRLIGPSYAYTRLASEASGRRAVTLQGVGSFVEFTLARPANAVNLRYSIPDSPDGAGLDASLGVFINGRQSAPMHLTSRYSHVYGEYTFTNKPSDGGEHHFFDDAHMMFDRTLPAGTRVRFQVRHADTAPSYTIDVADFEQVAPSAQQPTGSLSVIDFGADPTYVKDSTRALQAAIDAGCDQHKVVWIPAGHYLVSGHLAVDRVTLQGAGIWYSQLEGKDAGIFGNWAPNMSQDVHLSNFAIFGHTDHRDDTVADSGVGGMMTDSSVENLWIEHTKTGMWMNGPFEHLDVKGLRIQDTMADGINFDGGATDSSITNTFVRNSGDDGIALWSAGSADTRVRVSHNTVQLPVLANSFAVYGGTDNTVSDNVASDTVTQGGGIHLGNRFGATPLAGTTTVARNVVIRAGSLEYSDPVEEAAIWMWAADEPITGRTDLVDNVVVDAPHSAVQFFGQKITKVHVRNLKVLGAGRSVVQLQAPGSGTFTGVLARRIGGAGTFDCSSGFQVQRTGQNVGWRGTECGFGANGTLTVSTPALDFGEVTVGQAAAAQMITVINNGPRAVTIGPLHLPEGYTASTTCRRLSPKASCTIAVTFVPSGAGSFKGALRFDTTTPVGPYYVGLSGVSFDPNGNMALARPVTTTSSVPGFPGSNGNDNDPATYWESTNGAFPQSMTIDLGATRSIDRVVMNLPSSWGARTQTIEVQGSNVGASFTTLAAPSDLVFDPNTGNTVTVHLPRTSTRYVRVVVTNNTGWSAAQLSEVQVWGN